MSPVGPKAKLEAAFSTHQTGHRAHAAKPTLLDPKRTSLQLGDFWLTYCGSAAS
jgi:hypothetical protein